MAAIDQVAAQAIAVGLNATSVNEKGKALENLICFYFEQVPGISITQRNVLNAFDTEEVDVALWNDGAADGLATLPNVILVESKNWSHPVGSIEVAWFLTKLANRGLDFGILVARDGITGNAADLTAAHAVIAAALKDRRRLIVITTDELQALADTDQLTRLIKTKLCELAVKGTI
jgi:hypothetical protein